jgi:glycerophosphoryl diester phosphodiesterase
VGVYPETKHPSYFSALGLEHDEPLLEALRRFGYLDPRSRTRIFVQSFETANLRRLRARCDLPLVQLLEHEGAPYDLVAAGDTRTYQDLGTPGGLREIASYANAIGPNKLDVIPRRAENRLAEPTSLVPDAHAAGLEVHPWTFRAENAFLPGDLKSSPHDADRGDLAAELRAYADAGVDAVFTDQPGIARLAWRPADP